MDIKELSRNLSLNNISAYSGFNFGGCEHFPRIELGKYAISIQASDSHYSSPRTNLATVGDYKTVEVGLFFQDEFITPDKLASLNVSWAEDFDSGVAGYIPLERVQVIVDYFEALDNMDKLMRKMNNH